MILDLRIVVAVCGLERVREMCQNDAHLFVRPDQIKEEVGKSCTINFSCI